MSKVEHWNPASGWYTGPHSVWVLVAPIVPCSLADVHERVRSALGFSKDRIKQLNTHVSPAYIPGEAHLGLDTILRFGFKEPHDQW